MRTKKISLWILSLVFSLSMILAVGSFTAKKTGTETVNADTSSYKFAYLSDLPVKSSSNANFAINTTLNPDDVLDGAITLNRGAGNVYERYSKAITIGRKNGGTAGNDNSKYGTVTFDISGMNATRFTSSIGVNHFKADNQWADLTAHPKTATASFKVFLNGTAGNNYVDGTEAFNDGLEYNYNSTQGYIDIAIPSGTKTITLASYDVGEQDDMCEHAVFANPRIYGENLTVGQEANFLYLSEMPYDYKDYQDYYSGYSINTGYPYADGGERPLMLNINGTKQTFEKGMSIQANAKYGWDIGGTGAYRITGWVGLNQEEKMGLDDDRGSVKVKISYRINSGADAGYIYESDTFTRSTHAVFIDKQIPYGASHIAITVEDAGDGNSFDNATLADFKLYCDYAYLSDMTTASTSIGYGDLLNDSVLEGKSTLFNNITEGSTTHNVNTYFDKCVFMHATSSADYDISGMNATMFSAYCGIVSTKLKNGDTATPQQATFIVRVSYDGTTFEDLASLSMSRTDQMGIIKANIPHNAVKLRIITSASDTNSSHTLYCMPRIFANTPYATRAISLTATNDSLKVGETSTISLYSCSFGSLVTKANNSSFTLSSDNTAIVTVNNDNKTMTAVGQGQTTVRVVYTEGSVTIETDMTVLVGAENSSSNARMEVASPDGKTKIIVTLNNSWIDWSATKNGVLFAEKSRMGLSSTSLGDLTNGFTYKSTSAVKTINETYKTYSGKYLQNTDYCNERSITFSHGSGDTFTVVARAYNDGVAFRYIVKKADGGTFTITDEDTRICIPFFSDFYSCVMPDTADKTYTHEQTASKTMISQFGGLKTIPFMYKTPEGMYCLMTEADLTGNYWGSCVTSTYTKIMRLNHSAQQKSAVSVSGEVKLPWRVFIAGTLEEVIKSQMVENVATRADTSGTDWDWVEAGVTAWSWMSGLNADGTGKSWYNPTYGMGYQGNPEAIKQYIDLAAEMGWKYFIMDEGWQPWVYKANYQKVNNYTGDYDHEALKTGYQNFDRWYEGVYDWMTSKSKYWTQNYYSTETYTAGSYTGEKIIDYANKKGVKIIAWLHTGICDTPTRMERVFTMLEDIGIAGIKIDFFDSEDQATMELYDQLYAATAKHHLLGIFHGSNKPSGERVTYPNVLNREAINGEENNNTRISQHTLLSYFRGSVGPTDLTPYIYTVGKGDTNMASQMAFSIIYESGLTCFASTVDEFKALDDNIKYYYKNFPGRWADLKLLSGEVGENMSIARKAENGRWYIGSISETKRTDTFKLDFLDKGVTYTAHIYTDKDDRKSVDCQIKTVTSADTLTLTQRANGGYVVVLEAPNTVTCKNDGNGTVNVSSYSALAGTSITITTSPKAGYQLDKITVVDANGDAVTVSSNKFTMPTSAVTVTATFKAISYTVSKADATGGSVSLSQTSATVGQQITVNTTPNTGYELDKITVKDSSGNSVTVSGNKFTMPASSVTVTVTFKAINYTIMVNATGGSVNVNKTAKYGEQVTMSFTAESGYEFKSVTVKDGSGNSVTVTDNKFSMPASSVTITAVFEIKATSSSSSKTEEPVKPSSSSETPVEPSSSETPTEPSSSSKVEQDVSSSSGDTSFEPAKKTGCGANLNAGLWLIPLAMFALVIMVAKKGKKD